MNFLGSKCARIAFTSGILPRIPQGQLTALAHTPSRAGFKERGRGSRGRRYERQREYWREVKEGREGWEKLCASFSGYYILTVVYYKCCNSDLYDRTG